MESRELVKFAMYFVIIATALFAAFIFIFPYYRLLLQDIVKIFAAGVNLPEKISLTFMPFVAVTALVLATPKQSLKMKIKYAALIVAIFFLIDVGFSFAQIFTKLDAKNLLLLQDLLSLMLPIMFWFALNRKKFEM